MDDRQVIHFWWTPTYDDWVDAVKVHRRISRAYRSQLVTIGFGVLFVCYAAFGLHSAALTVAAIAAFIYLAASDMIWPRLSWRRTWQQHSGMHNGIRGTVHPDDGLTFEVATATMIIRWPAVVMATETERQFVLFIDAFARGFHQIPKGAALDDETIERFRDLLHQRLDLDRSPTI